MQFLDGLRKNWSKSAKNQKFDKKPHYYDIYFIVHKSLLIVAFVFEKNKHVTIDTHIKSHKQLS